MDEDPRSGLGVAAIEGSGPGALPEDVREDLRLGRKVAFAAGEEGRPYRRQEVAETLGVRRNAVEPDEHPGRQHPAETFVMGLRGACDLLEPGEDPAGDPVDVGQDQILLARKMEIDRPLADPHLAGDVLHGHLPVAVPGQEDLHGVEDQVPDVFSTGDASHGDL